MSEVAAIEKLETLITESQSPEQEEQKLFTLDRPYYISEIEVIYSEDDREILYHKIKWPTLDALINRQQQTPQKTQRLGARKSRYYNDDGSVDANAQLWERFRVQVKGYTFEEREIDSDQWVDVSDELAKEIPIEHKSEAIVSLFASKFEVERQKRKGFVLGAQTYRVKQTYGPYTIWHIFNKPSDRDRRDLARRSRMTDFEPGTNTTSEIFTNLKPYYDLYENLFDHLEGVTGDDPNIGRRKDLINAIWRFGAIEALMDSFEAPRRDSSTN